ncbi:MAG: hypothetical protein GKR99_11315 [Rhodobacteraceae bacterium]|nr:hypothetical protein [Paracoccaceae bacterium]
MMKSKILAGAALVAPILAGQVQVDSHLPEAPEYYLETVIGVSLAEQYVWHCPDLRVNAEAFGAAYAVVLERLAEIGVPSDAPHEHMLLPPAEETDAVIRDMLARNEDADDPGAAFCAEARAEMAASSVVGTFLAEGE